MDYFSAYGSDHGSSTPSPRLPHALGVDDGEGGHVEEAPHRDRRCDGVQIGAIRRLHRRRQEACGPGGDPNHTWGVEPDIARAIISKSLDRALSASEQAAMPEFVAIRGSLLVFAALKCTKR